MHTVYVAEQLQTFQAAAEENTKSQHAVSLHIMCNAAGRLGI
jgi:hypothetical protein